MTDSRRDLALPPDNQPVPGGGQAMLRASDAGRDHTAAILASALATGRLTSTEHAERLDAAYAAKTLGELARLTGDLPADGATDSGAAVVDRVTVAKLIVTVPEGAHVIDEGGALFAKRAIYGRRRDTGDADGPVIRLVGDARFAKVAVHRGDDDPRDAWQPRALQLAQRRERHRERHR